MKTVIFANDYRKNIIVNNDSSCMNSDVNFAINSILVKQPDHFIFVIENTNMQSIKVMTAVL